MCVRVCVRARSSIEYITKFHEHKCTLINRGISHVLYFKSPF